MLKTLPDCCQSGNFFRPERHVGAKSRIELGEAMNDDCEHGNSYYICKL